MGLPAWCLNFWHVGHGTSHTSDRNLIPPLNDKTQTVSSVIQKLKFQLNENVYERIYDFVLVSLSYSL